MKKRWQPLTDVTQARLTLREEPVRHLPEEIARGVSADSIRSQSNASSLQSAP
jgi:hypothetical protein